MIAEKLKNEEAYWLAIFRLFPLVRALVSVPAGMIRMPHKLFILYSLAGFAIWTTFWTLLGYYFGLGFVGQRFGVLAVIIAIFLIIIVVFVKRMKGYLAKEGLRF